MNRAPQARIPGARYLASSFKRGASFLLGWILLTEGARQDAWLGLVVTALATAASFLVLAPGAVTSLRPAGLLRFLGYFAVQSIKGGVDVSLRALRPSLPVNPGFVTLDLDIDAEGLRILFAWTASLLPGTAGVNLDGRRLDLHVLNTGGDAEAELHHLAAVINALSRPDRDHTASAG